MSAYGVEPQWSLPSGSVTQSPVAVWVGFAGTGGATVGSGPTCNRNAGQNVRPQEAGDALCFSPSTRSAADHPPVHQTLYRAFFIFAFYPFVHNKGTLWKSGQPCSLCIGAFIPVMKQLICLIRQKPWPSLRHQRE